MQCDNLRAVRRVAAPREPELPTRALIYFEQLFGACQWRMPKARSTRRAASERSRVIRVFRFLQIGTGPRRSLSACSEMMKKYRARRWRVEKDLPRCLICAQPHRSDLSPTWLCARGVCGPRRDHIFYFSFSKMNPHPLACPRHAARRTIALS